MADFKRLREVKRQQVVLAPFRKTFSEFIDPYQARRPKVQLTVRDTRHAHPNFPTFGKLADCRFAPVSMDL